MRLLLIESGPDRLGIYHLEVKPTDGPAVIPGDR